MSPRRAKLTRTARRASLTGTQDEQSTYLNPKADRKQVETPSHRRTHSSGSLGDRLQNRHALHVVGHREDMQSGPLQKTCRSEAVFPPHPGPVDGSVRHTCVTDTDMRHRHQDRDHSRAPQPTRRQPGPPTAARIACSPPTRPSESAVRRKKPPGRQAPGQGGVREGSGTDTEGCGRRLARHGGGVITIPPPDYASVPAPSTHAMPRPLWLRISGNDFAIAMWSQRCGTSTNGAPAA